MLYTYEFPRPSLTADIVLFAEDGGDLKVLLIKRANEPYKDGWALPGGFVEMDEPVKETAVRELEEETGVTGVPLKQFYAFGDDIHRDPRGRTVTVAYYGITDLNKHKIRASSDAKEARWFSVNNLPIVAFDHSEIIKMALEQLTQL